MVCNRSKQRKFFPKEWGGSKKSWRNKRTAPYDEKECIENYGKKDVVIENILLTKYESQWNFTMKNE